LPERHTLHPIARLVFSFLGNLALLVLISIQKEHLFDIRDYRYVTVDFNAVFLFAIVPVILLITLFPVFRSDRSVCRWFALALSVLPGALLILEWVQWFTL